MLHSEPDTPDEAPGQLTQNVTGVQSCFHSFLYFVTVPMATKTMNFMFEMIGCGLVSTFLVPVLFLFFVPCLFCAPVPDLSHD